MAIDMLIADAALATLAPPPTRAAIMAARTPAGGWTKETLANWGVSWPPEKGWIDRLLAENKPETNQDLSENVSENMSEAASRPPIKSSDSKR